MSFDDFVRKFDSLDVCKVSAWDELRLRGRFIRYTDALDPHNHEIVASKWLYALEVPSKTHVVIGLHQEDERIEGTLPKRAYLDAGLAILKRSAPDGTSLFLYKNYSTSRDCELECIMEPGSYIVVPRTTGCAIKRPSDIDEPLNTKLLDNKKQPTEIFDSTIGDIFRKFDLVINNTIDFKEFKGLYDIIGKKITELEYKNQILPNFNSTDEG